MRRFVRDRLFYSKGPGEKWILFLWLFTRLVLFPTSVYAAIPPAGQVISSRSMATYGSNGSQRSVLSNEVLLSVTPFYGPYLVPDGTPADPAATARAFSGETVTFPFLLSNSGNDDDTFTIEIVPAAPSGFVAQSAVVYLDADGDSLVDPGENIVTEVGPLAMGERVSLVLAAALPEGLAGGETAHLDLTARSAGDTAVVDENNVVRIIAREEASIPLSLEADAAEVLPGEEVTFTMRFSNTGERSAVDVAVTDYIDYGGMITGTEYVAGSVAASLPGTIEFYDLESSLWVEAAPAPGSVKGVRLRLESLPPGTGGSLSFTAHVDDDHQWGEIVNTASVDYTGGDASPYGLNSNEVTVRVGRVSSIAIGPAGNPTAEDGTPEDCVVVSLNGNDTTYTFWHEILNSGNFTDTLRVVLSDSAAILGDWNVQFVDSTGVSLDHGSVFSARVGALQRGCSCLVGLRLLSSPESFRRFAGRELSFDVEAQSLVDGNSRDDVQDVLIKTDMPLLSVKQSIREPTALVGDVLSYIVTVENLTEETPVDSVLLVENLSAGLGYAGGSDDCSTGLNVIRWSLGRIEPGDKRRIIFRARVKAGQERDRLLSAAWVYGTTELGERTSDGPAIASVRIVEGVFTRRGIILGSVFRDGDGNGIKSKGEEGIAGVSVFIEDGTYAVTDSSGLYSIPGVVEGTHVVRIDPETLPDSLVPGNTGYFGMGVKGEILTELAPSGNRRADFPLERSSSATAGDTSAAIGVAAPAVALAGEFSDPGDAASTGTRSAIIPVIPGGGAPGEIDSSFGPAAASAGFEADSIAGETLDITGGDTSTDLNADEMLTARGGRMFNAMTIPSTYFAPGDTHLEEIPLKQIATLGLWLRDNPGWRVLIAGHTDSIPIGTAEFPSNFELSLHRARTVFQLLRMNGIPEDRMDYTGYGSRVPIASNSTEEGRAGNRRVEIRVVPPDDYIEGDPLLPGMLDRPDTTTFSLADEAGVCAEIVKPEEGHVYYLRDEIDVEVMSPLGSAIELYVNNVPVGRERIGQKRIDVGGGTLGLIFYGVRITAGRNDILVVCKEHGGDRSTCIRRVYLAGRPSGIIPEKEIVSVPADGRTSPEIVFLVKDEAGLPVRDGIFVTVEGPADLIKGLDVNPHQVGIQVSTENGRAVLTLPPSRDSRREQVHVSLGGLSSGCRLSYESLLRDWFLFGYGEGEVGFSNLTGSGTAHRSFERYHDGLFAEGKIALYGQGEIRSGHLMTLAMDSRPLREDRLFRRIEPEKYYPIYGDASELRFNTASRSGTYVKLDHRRYSAMFGDFRTELGSTEFTRYHRSFNGLEGEVRFGRGSLNAFLTRTDQVTYQEEIPADGTSGFYFLENYPLIENSEKIRIEVRDRYQPERILKVDYKQVNRDYDINYMDGSILFKEPVNATDRDLNPVTIVVSYECRNSGERNFIYGMRSSMNVTDSLGAGITAVLEEEGVENSSLIGVDISGLLLRAVELEGEFAHSEKFLLGGANAFRLKLGGHHGGAFRWNVYYRDIDKDFFNPSFSGGKTELGSRKYGADFDYKINRAFSVRTKGYRHAFRERDERKDYIDLLGTYTSNEFSGKMGFAGAAHSDTRDGDHSAVLILAGLGMERGRTRAELQWDQILSGEEVQEYPNRLQAKLTRRLWKKVSASLKHEYRTGSRTGSRHLTQLGIESHLNENLHLFSRYRLEGAMSGERAQATVGLKNRFRILEDLTGTFSVEKLATVSGRRSDDFLAVSTGCLYTPAQKDYRLKGDYEIRLEPERRKHLAGLAALKRMSERWSALVKGDLWFSDEKLDLDRVKGSSTIGFSLRPDAGVPLTLLSLIKGTYEKNSPAHPGEVDRELFTSIEANYAVGSLWELEGKVAARWVRNAFKSYMADASTFLYQAQVIRIIGGRWDVGLKGRVVHQRETHTFRFGGGLEAGRLVAENVWLGVGYDFGGHDDRDAEINDFRQSGFHVKMRLKFNEKLMKYFYGES